MIYKALITGNNYEIIDEFFAHMDNIDTMTTSNRYHDVVKHIKYFTPDIFVYCIRNESKEDYSKIIPIKHLLAKHRLPFAVVGSKEECDKFEQIAVNIADLILHKPLETDAIQEKISAFLAKWKEEELSAQQKPAAQENTAAQAPAGHIPADPMSAAAQMPMGQMPAGQMFMGQMPVGQVPGQMPVAQAPVNPAPVSNAKEESKKETPKPEEPKKPEKPKLTAADERRRRKRRIRGRGRILVIDDNPLMLKVIKEHLHDEYDVATAVNGKVAFRFLEHRRVDLILLDYEMPGEDGPDILERLRAKETTTDVPVIFLTGISDRKKIKKALMMKPEGYLLKPIDHDKLISTIKKYIG